MDTLLNRNLTGIQEEQSSTLLAFDELQSRSLSLSVRATALVFEDPVSRRLLEQIERIAPSDATVLIIGETGTGKELVARHIHALSKRSKNIFGALNCAALSENLIESELFGHEKGSFTGALTSKEGWFETANKGSLFLDEVGDLPCYRSAKWLKSVPGILCRSMSESSRPPTSIWKKPSPPRIFGPIYITASMLRPFNSAPCANVQAIFCLWLGIF
jgi:sigma-54-specific transcriptional regulator